MRRFGWMLAALTALAATAQAAPCPADALGTSRVMMVDPAAHPRVGKRSYPETLPLAPGEVVLTFDDGPLPGPTDRVLETLARHCVRATFFLIGRNAAANPRHVRRIAAAGHTLANHSQTHPWTMRDIAHEAAWRNIEDGREAIERAAGGAIAPFFRFPGFADTPALLDRLAAQKTAVFGTDLWASDWVAMAPEAQLKLVLGRLKANRGGIVLFHDTRPQTAAMLPAFLEALRESGYRVVHLVAR